MRRGVAHFSAAFQGVLREAASAAETRTFSTNFTPQWIFLGPPGVGKGTYSKCIAKHMGVPHISTGDLVRDKIAEGTAFGKMLHEMNVGGNLLPDETIFKLLEERIGNERGGFVLDGYPRRRSQAERLAMYVDIHLVINLDLREEVLVEKCMGRRSCAKCGKGFNLANIYLEGKDGKKTISMPPLMPPKQCLPFMHIREDDKDKDIIEKRIREYKAEAKPVEDFYRQFGTLVDFEITGSFTETLPRMLEEFQSYFPNGTEEHSKMVA